MIKFFKSHSALIGILLIAGFLLFYRLTDLAMFIGDFGWFYISARDSLLNNTIPLVSIATSHPWLHQGPLWTYILIFVFKIFNFNPFAPTFLSALLGLISVFTLYFVTKQMFSKQIGLIAAFLYATSPLVVISARYPYHTSPIPLFTILLIYAVYKWIKVDVKYFPLVMLFLSILYNFELATFTLLISVVGILVLGVFKKKQWVLKLINKRIIFYSFLALIIPMLPMFIYDTTHNYPQTIKFIMWLGYKILVFFGYPQLHPEITTPTFLNVLYFAKTQYVKLIFPVSPVVSLVIFSVSILIFVKIFINKLTAKQLPKELIILTTFLSTVIIGFFLTKTISEAYLPQMFPFIIIFTAICLNFLISTPKIGKLILLLLIFVGLLNSLNLINNNYFVERQNTLAAKLFASKQIIKLANGKEYNLIAKGNGDKFESFVMPYNYLTWKLGNEPSKIIQKLKIYLKEDLNTIYVSLIK